MTDFDDPVAVQGDLDLMTSRRAFPEAQAAFSGAVLETAGVDVTAGWHGSRRHPETGAVALVDRDGPLADLVGDIIAVTRRMGSGDRLVYVYVINRADLDVDLSLSRRAFFSLGLLANEDITVTVEVIA